jgi:exportin-7
MVASVPYVKATEPHLLETYTPEVSNAYITSRLESVAVVVRYCTLHLKMYSSV